MIADIRQTQAEIQKIAETLNPQVRELFVTMAKEKMKTVGPLATQFLDNLATAEPPALAADTGPSGS